MGIDQQNAFKAQVPDRDLQACKNRWTRIRLLVQYWVSAVKRVDDLCKSGQSEEDKEVEVQKVYASFIKGHNQSKPKAQHLKESFALHHCYDLLVACPKFAVSKKVASSTAPENAAGDGVQEASEEDNKREETERLARKHAEEDSNYKRQNLEQGRESTEALKASAAAMEQRNKFEIFTHPACPPQIRVVQTFLLKRPFRNCDFSALKRHFFNIYHIETATFRCGMWENELRVMFFFLSNVVLLLITATTSKDALSCMNSETITYFHN
jgi:hypothetical protein